MVGLGGYGEEGHSVKGYPEEGTYQTLVPVTHGEAYKKTET